MCNILEKNCLRKLQKHNFLPVVCAIWAFSVISAVLVEAADLPAYKDVYNKNLEEIILSHGPKLAAVDQQYAKSIEALKAKVQSEGNLDKTKSVMAEIERFRREKTINSAAVLPELKELQAVSSKQTLDLELDKARKIINLTARYDGVLDRLQKELTKAGKIDEATVIQDERNNVKNSDYLAAANMVMASASGGDDGNAGTSGNTVDAGRGSEEKIPCNVSGSPQPDRPLYLNRSPMLEGFSKSLEWFARREWGTYRGGEQKSFWSHVQGKNAQITWETQKIGQEDIRTAPSATFVFGGGMGFDSKRTGTWQVEVNGQPALQVRFPVEESTLWEYQGYRLYFEHHGEVNLGYKGIFFLTVPRQVLKMNAAQQLKFSDHAQPDDNSGWVMVNEYTDMVADISKKDRKKR